MRQVVVVVEHFQQADAAHLSAVLMKVHLAEYQIFYLSQVCPYHPVEAAQEAVQEVSRFLVSLVSFRLMQAAVNYHL